MQGSALRGLRTGLYDRLRITGRIGTSGHVINVSMFTQWFNYSILNNLDLDNMVDPFFKTVYIEKAMTVAPDIEADIENFLVP
ncbi:MAG: hypothetical protein WA099_09975 [Sulfuricurvum sp.]